MAQHNSSSYDPTQRVPGQDDWFDLLAGMFGMGEEGAQNERGQALGLNIPSGSIHHALNAEDLARRQGGAGMSGLGLLLAQLGGLGVEGVEYGMQPATLETPQGRQD